MSIRPYLCTCKCRLLVHIAVTLLATGLYRQICVDKCVKKECMGCSNFNKNKFFSFPYSLYIRPPLQFLQGFNSMVWH